MTLSERIHQLCDNANVEASEVTLTIEEARSLEFQCDVSGSSAADDLATQLDEVQSKVFVGECTEAFLLIRITTIPG